MAGFEHGLRVLLAAVTFEGLVFFLAYTFGSGSTTASASLSHGVDNPFRAKSECGQPGEQKHYVHLAYLEFFLALCMFGLFLSIHSIKQVVDADSEAEKEAIEITKQTTVHVVSIAREKAVDAKNAFQAAEKHIFDAQTECHRKDAAYTAAVNSREESEVRAAAAAVAAAASTLEMVSTAAAELKKSYDNAQKLYEKAVDQSTAAIQTKGMARFPKAKRVFFRIMAILVIVLSLWCSALGIVTFMEVLDYKLGCVDAFQHPTVLVSIIIVGFVVFFFHARLAFIAVTED